MNIAQVLSVAYQALEILLEHFEEIEIDGEMMEPSDVLQMVGDALEVLPAAPEPDWSQAPEWAQYHVHDPACVWAWWLENWPKHPQLLTRMFTGRWMPYENPLPVGIDYRTTLSTRPEANNA